jgi:hypothetical protein
LPALLAVLQFPFLAPLIPRQRKALAAVELIRDTTNTLIRWVLLLLIWNTR